MRILSYSIVCTKLLNSISQSIIRLQLCILCDKFSINNFCIPSCIWNILTTQSVVGYMAHNKLLYQYCSIAPGAYNCQSCTPRNIIMTHRLELYTAYVPMESSSYKSVWLLVGLAQGHPNYELMDGLIQFWKPDRL